MVPDAVARSAEDFHALLMREQVTVFDPNPVGRRSTRNRRTEQDAAALVIGAEPCPPELVDRWAPGRVIFNVYGPTETTMWALQKHTPDAPVPRCATDRRTHPGGGVFRPRRLATPGTASE